MKIHEYQAKSLLKTFNVPVAKGEVVTDLSQVEAAYKNLNSPVVAVNC